MPHTTVQEAQRPVPSQEAPAEEPVAQTLNLDRFMAPISNGKQTPVKAKSPEPSPVVREPSPPQPEPSPVMREPSPPQPDDVASEDRKSESVPDVMAELPVDYADSNSDHSHHVPTLQNITSEGFARIAASKLGNNLRYVSYLCATPEEGKTKAIFKEKNPKDPHKATEMTDVRPVIPIFRTHRKTVEQKVLPVLQEGETVPDDYDGVVKEGDVFVRYLKGYRMEPSGPGKRGRPRLSEGTKYLKQSLRPRGRPRKDERTYPSNHPSITDPSFKTVTFTQLNDLPKQLRKPGSRTVGRKPRDSRLATLKVKKNKKRRAAAIEEAEKHMEPYSSTDRNMEGVGSRPQSDLNEADMSNKPTRVETRGRKKGSKNQSKEKDVEKKEEEKENENEKVENEQEKKEKEKEEKEGKDEEQEEEEKEEEEQDEEEFDEEEKKEERGENEEEREEEREEQNLNKNKDVEEEEEEKDEVQRDTEKETEIPIFENNEEVIKIDSGDSDSEVSRDEGDDAAAVVRRQREQFLTLSV